jgi:hypothetical protein
MNSYQEYFNKTPGKALATTDKNGNPNVCMCGSAFMIDDNTIIAASGFFDRTETNIQDTNKAVFMAFMPLSLEFFKHYEETGERQYPAGYRFYCTLKETATSGPLLENVKERLRERVGNRIPDSLRNLMVFDIDEIRELDF